MVSRVEIRYFGLISIIFVVWVRYKSEQCQKNDQIQLRTSCISFWSIFWIFPWYCTLRVTLSLSEVQTWAMPKKLIKSNSWLYVYHFGAFSESFHDIAHWGGTWVWVRYKSEQCQSNAPPGSRGAPPGARGAPPGARRAPPRGTGIFAMGRGTNWLTNHEPCG